MILIITSRKPITNATTKNDSFSLYDIYYSKRSLLCRNANVYFNPAPYWVKTLPIFFNSIRRQKQLKLGLFQIVYINTLYFSDIL